MLPFCSGWMYSRPSTGRTRSHNPLFARIPRFGHFWGWWRAIHQTRFPTACGHIGRLEDSQRGVRRPSWVSMKRRGDGGRLAGFRSVVTGDSSTACSDDAQSSGNMSKRVPSTPREVVFPIFCSSTWSTRFGSAPHPPTIPSETTIKRSVVRGADDALARYAKPGSGKLRP